MTSGSKIAFFVIYSLHFVAFLAILALVRRPSRLVRKFAASGIFLAVMIISLSVPTFWWEVGYAGKGWQVTANNGKAALTVTDDRRFTYSQGWFCQDDASIADVVFAPFPTIRLNDPFNAVSIPVAAMAIGLALLSFVASYRATPFPVNG